MLLVNKLFFAMLAAMMSMTMILMSIYIAVKILRWKVNYLSNFEYMLFSIVAAVFAMPLILVVIPSLYVALKPYGCYGVLAMASLNILLCLLCNKICR